MFCVGRVLTKDCTRR